MEAAAKVALKPDEGGLPGDEALQKLLNGAGKYALLACLAAFLWGAAQWGLGNHSNNYSQSSSGKTRMIAGVVGAFAIGAAAALINFFFDAGSGVH
jgi:hypothetical protein